MIQTSISMICSAEISQFQVKNSTKVTVCVSSLIVLAGAFVLAGTLSFNKNLYVSFMDEFGESVIESGKLSPGAHHFFNEKISLKYRYAHNNYTLTSNLMSGRRPMMEFKLFDGNNRSIPFSIKANHRCYYDVLDLNKLNDKSDDYKLVYEWNSHIETDSDWLKKQRPDCYNVKPPKDLWIMISSKDDSFQLKIPFEIKESGFYISYDLP